MNLTELLDQINNKGISIITVSHDIDFMCRACDQLKLMNNGRIIAEGASSEVVTEHNLAEAFQSQDLCRHQSCHNVPKDHTPRQDLSAIF